MRAMLFTACLLGCTSQPASQGTVWYVDPGSGAVHRVDVASRGDKTLDASAMFDQVAADPKSQAVAYTTADGKNVSVADRAGKVTQLSPGSGQPTHPAWQPGSWLVYRSVTNNVLDVAIAHPPAQPRLLGASGPALFAADGASLVYVAGTDLDFEQSDGTGKRMIASGVPAAISLAPDGGSVLATASTGDLEAIAIADGTTRDLGPGAVLASPTYDTEHVLVIDATGLSVVSVADGTRTQVVAATATDVGLPAELTPSGNVIYGLVVDHSTNDTPDLTTDVFVFDGSTSTALLSSPGYCNPRPVSHHGLLVPIACTEPTGMFLAQAYLAGLADGSMVQLSADDVLGFETDDRAVIATSSTSPTTYDVVRITVDGVHTTTLAHATSATYLP